MSTAKRLISGTVVSWGQIFVTIISQIVVVPIYLSHWKSETFGIWVAIQSLLNLITVFDFGHQTYLGYEFLRLGKDNWKELQKSLWSGVAFGIIISIVQIILIAVFLATNTLSSLLNISKLRESSTLHEAGIILILQGFTWLICTSTSGLLSRALETFGYYPRISLWNLFISIVTTLAPTVAVICGAGLLTAGIISAIATVVCTVPQYWDFIRLLNSLKITFVFPSLRIGLNNFIYSLALSGRALLENTRQQGVRLIVAPFSGIKSLASFSTMRTMSNFALQGLNTVTHPLMPELSRFLHKRDQNRMEAAMGTLWIVLIAFMAPVMVTLQAFIEPLYLLWTRGQLTFDPTLFAVLSSSVLVYAVAQPAMAIVIGNNMLKTQIFVSTVVAIIVIVGIFILIPIIGILAAGIALLSAEAVAMIGYKIAAQRWLIENGLKWPKKAFFIAITSVGISASAMEMMILLPSLKWIILTVSLIILFWNVWRYWQVLPKLAIENVMKIVSKIPNLKFL